jgi:hypothetical protein
VRRVAELVVASELCYNPATFMQQIPRKSAQYTAPPVNAFFGSSLFSVEYL